MKGPSPDDEPWLRRQLRRGADGCCTWIVCDELWDLIAPCFREGAPLPLRVEEAARREALQGSCSSCTPGSPGATATRARLRFRCDLLRRLDEWQRAGVWERLHALLLARLCTRGRSSGLGRSPTPARCRRKRGRRNGRSPVDRGRPGSKHHLLVDGTVSLLPGA